MNPENESAYCQSLINTPCYFFNTAPPLAPRLYFKEKTLFEMLVWGSVACPYTAPQDTVFPSDGQLGRWTMNYDKDKIRQIRNVSVYVPEPTCMKRVREDMIGLLPDMLMRYEDFGTGKFTVWMLTSDVIQRDSDNNLRLGVLPG
jgi:hypothetical protein